MKTEVLAYKPVQVKEGQWVKNLAPLKNGVISLDALSSAKVVAKHNEVEASLWFTDVGRYYQDPVSRALDVKKSAHQNGALEGVVLSVKREKFAVCYKPFDSFDDVTVEANRLQEIPFFKHNESLAYPSQTSRRNDVGEMEQVRYYVLRDIITIIDENFAEWVEKHVSYRPITEEEIENEEYPSDWENVMTEESIELFYETQHELHLKFAERTGVFKEFTGGLCFE